MAKIQISTIEKQANIQVIELNSSFISRSMRAMMTVEAIASEVRSIKKVWDDKKGSIEVKDDKGNPVYEYGKKGNGISENNAKILCEKVLPFLQELTDAFEAE